MLDPADIVRFSDTPAPEGASPWVGGAAPARDIEIVPPDPAWPERFAALETRIRAALGERVLALEHVGSTSVPDFAAKPIIDIDLTVADGADEPAYVPALEAAGFTFRVREPWWYGHRLLGADDPRAFVHVWSPDTPEPVRHVIFRDWLRGHPDDRAEYAAAKHAAAEAANAHGEDMMSYNDRKQDVIRAIYARAFRAAGLLG